MVDDEPAVCQFLESMLTGEGHEAETSASAGDALEKIKKNRYNLILLDIKLPGKSGIELYKRMQRIAESLARRIVFITGDMMGTDTRREGYGCCSGEMLPLPNPRYTTTWSHETSDTLSGFPPTRCCRSISGIY